MVMHCEANKQARKSGRSSHWFCVVQYTGSCGLHTDSVVQGEHVVVIHGGRIGAALKQPFCDKTPVASFLNQ
jgi:hypothetical protein